ncbi:MAG: glycosyltransferase family 2 protein [Bacteroidetes bacterium]|nr:glycosyltransferase family 2 protein [Bacteroidota bacterium]
MIQSLKIYVALPVLDEYENLQRFISCYQNQTWSNKKLVVCVNQPDQWGEKETKKRICENNQESIKYLNGLHDIDIEVIDRSSKGQGWTTKKYGVGWARKVVMDRVSELAGPNDILISLDADTTFNPGYFESVFQTLNSNPDAVALAVPYHHKHTEDEEKDRAILHYEIYMRYYAINLWRISNPYAFTAVGSAIALPVRAYRAIGGITPHNSGEDFYFMQKLRKYGKILTYNPEKVYPAARYSDRVGFGTGPAMIKGSKGDWRSYPIYPYQLFDEIKATTDLFPNLFKQDISTPMDAFNQKKFGENNIWQALRTNFKTEEKFIKACYHKIDALRILQYLKWRNQDPVKTDEENLSTFMKQYYPKKWQALGMDNVPLDFEKSKILTLDLIRNLLAEIEAQYQQAHDSKKT